MPDWKQEIRTRLAGLELDPEREGEIFEEFADHLDDRYEELRASGASEREAIEGALGELQGSGLLAAELRGMRAAKRATGAPAGAAGKGSLTGDFFRDLRHAARMLRKSPAFTAIVVLTLALGIGANTMVFTVIDTILLNPLPVEKPSELAAIYSLDTDSATRAENLVMSSYLNLTDYAGQNDVFSELTGYSTPLSLTVLKGSGSSGASPERMFAELVTGNYFETLGLRPVLGRFFLGEEGRIPGTFPVVVIGYGPWQRRFGGTRDVIGRTVRINDVVFTIVGVAPKGFKGLNAVFGPDLWIPAMMAEQVLPAQSRDWLTDRGAQAFRAAGRLWPGATIGQAEANLKTIAAALADQYPDVNRGRSVAVRPLTRLSLQGSGSQASVMGSAVGLTVVGLVLLIACSNVANLLLARAAGRRQEIVVRLALGAKRSRLLRQLLTESVLLALISGVAGLAVAFAGCQLLWSFRPPEFAANLIDLSADADVFVFGLAVSVLTGLVFGAAPAWKSSRADLVVALKEETRTAGRSRARIRLGNALVAGQVALSLVSLITAGLFLRKIQRDYAIDPGFETHRLGIVMTYPGQAGYDRPRTEQFYRDVRERVGTIPQVESVSWATNLPLFSSPSRSVLIEGQERRDDSSGILTVVNTIDLDYFATAGVPIQSGRDFSEADAESTKPVAIINETMAARYWPGQEVIGKRFQFAGEDVLRQIVGVARTANYDELGEEPLPCIYLPLRQSFSDEMVLYVRTSGDPAPVLGSVQREMRNIDDQVLANDVRTIGKMIDQALFGARIGVGLLGVFGLLALGLASLGLYGVMAYAVNVRQREIGLRMALGASRGGVLRLVLGQGMTLAAVGVAVGVVASLLVGSALSGILHGVSPADPVSLAGSSLILLAVAALACYLPARRASRLDPLAALRDA
jgi:predicted permease